MSRKGSYLKKHLESGGSRSEPSLRRHVSYELDAGVRDQFEEGQLLLIDKPVHWTSFDVVKKIRGLIRIKKTGHAGTLDPLASGLLVICTGKFTKKINELMTARKTYTGSVTVGAVTPTYDLESLPEQHQDYSYLSEGRIREAAESFLGESLQMPPLYSAIKVKGTPLYELARRGKEVELEPRRIFISEFDITEVNLPLIRFRVTCSTGTYIRSLAHDFGKLLGCGAYLSELRRTHVGDFDVRNAETMETFTERISTFLKAMDAGSENEKNDQYS